MYDSFSEWRNEIRRAEKALRLMKEAQSQGIGGCWRSDLNRAVEQLEAHVEYERKSYTSEKHPS